MVIRERRSGHPPRIRRGEPSRALRSNICSTSDWPPDDSHGRRPPRLRATAARPAAAGAGVSARRPTGPSSPSSSCALEFAHASPALPGQEPWEPDEAPSWLEDSSESARRGGQELDRAPGRALGRAGGVRRRQRHAHDGREGAAARRAGASPIGRPRSGPRCGLAGCPRGGPGGWRRRCWASRRTCAATSTPPSAERLVDGAAIGPVVLDRLVDEAMLRLHCRAARARAARGAGRRAT